MFTGIIEALCAVHALAETGGIRRISVRVPESYSSSIDAGDSVAVNGVCLTRTGPARQEMLEFDVVAETLSRSNLGALVEGDHVNLERALRFGDHLGGHLVSGHVWSTTSCLAVEQQGENRMAWFSLDEESTPYVLHKGFVALDGTSLTVAKLAHDEDRAKFAVTLIPETRERTRLGALRQGDRINLEVDGQVQAIVDTVRQVLGQSDSPLGGMFSGTVKA